MLSRSRILTIHLDILKDEDARGTFYARTWEEVKNIYTTRHVGQE